jgi:hypothetical protein
LVTICEYTIHDCGDTIDEEEEEEVDTVDDVVSWLLLRLCRRRFRLFCNTDCASCRIFGLYSKSGRREEEDEIDDEFGMDDDDVASARGVSSNLRIPRKRGGGVDDEKSLIRPPPL